MISGPYTQATTGVSPYSQASTGGGQPPKKYVKIDGVMQLNPEYKAWKAQQGQPATTALNPDKALPVVTNMDDHAQLCDASKAAGDGAVPLSPATNATIEMMQEPEISGPVGLSTDDMVDALGAMFAKYEVPMGLMNKLMCVSEYHGLEFILDDSGSMSCPSDTKDAHGIQQTRWAEAHARLKSMVEILAYVPTPPMTIRFLNRQNTVELRHNGETPQDFINNANSLIDAAFMQGPQGMTPAKERLAESFARGAGMSIARYFFGDGTPSGGQTAISDIEKMVTNRQNPSGNPVTFLSCTNQDDQVEWMKELEELAPFCAEYDDFKDEAEEVARDQGDALPYTKGFHLIGQLVGAMNPDDLDAMDESVPFTKWTLDNLLGTTSTDQEYRHYFNEFKAAQQRRVVNDQMDQIKKSANWEADFQQFTTVHIAKDIPSVQQFKQRLKNAK